MDNVNMLVEPIRESLHQIGAFLPRLLLAIVVLVIGWLLAKLVRFAIVKALRAVNFNVVTEKAGIDRFLSQGGAEIDTVRVLGGLFYWLVILASLMVAFNTLDLAYVTDAKCVPPESLDRLRGARVLVVNGLFRTPHPTHLSIPEAIDVAAAVGAERAYLTHLTHKYSHAELEAELPPHVRPAYDGLTITI